MINCIQLNEHKLSGEEGLGYHTSPNIISMYLNVKLL